jgi:hypothetical protein
MPLGVMLRRSRTALLIYHCQPESYLDCTFFPLQYLDSRQAPSELEGMMGLMFEPLQVRIRPQIMSAPDALKTFFVENLLFREILIFGHA